MLRTLAMAALTAFMAHPAAAEETNLGAHFVVQESSDDPDIIASVMIDRLACDGPSRKARLRAGDLILGVNGQPVVRKTFEEFERIIGAAEILGVFTLTIWRAGGSIFSVTLRPAEHSGDYSCDGSDEGSEPGI